MSEEITFALENGDSWTGSYRVQPQGSAEEEAGEAVFYTGYTGYEECLTDPSYKGQVLIFCYPLIGNYGVDPSRFESDEVQPNLVVCREATDDLAEWLDDEGVPLIDSVDTRDIVTTIRDEGSMTCGLGSDTYQALLTARETPSVSEIKEMPRRVGTDEKEHHGPSDGPTIALLDCGVKDSMIEQFTKHGAHVVRLPNDTDPTMIESQDPAVVFVSNGPGDPKHYDHVIETVEAFSGHRPLAGICLGQQVIAHAHAGDTEQMKFGHRGSNQPVLTETGLVKMTTQNHSFEVSDPGTLTVTERNVNDDSPEGLRSEDPPVLTRQYHPEANPGPHDSFGFFDAVLDMGRKT